MATLDVGSASGRRALNHELPLVPFIDSLLCIVAFLLVTAVWSQMAKLDATAAVPASGLSVDEPRPEPELHVQLLEHEAFLLSWRLGGIVLSEEKIARPSAPPASGVTRFPELSARVRELWRERGVHRAASDPRRDRAVLQTSNDAPFEDVVAAMDAIAASRRPGSRGGSIPVFDVTFAAD